MPDVVDALHPAALGTMTFGDTVEPRTADAIVRCAVDRGIRMIDTANVYSGGECERILSAVLPALPDDVVVATKVGMPHDDAGEAAPLSATGIRLCVEGSVRRLGRDRVDVLYLHQPDRSTPLEETLEATARLIADGTVGALGISNFAAWQIAEIRALCSGIGIEGPVIAQQVYNLVARRIEDEYAEFARSAGLATVAYNPLAGGLLAAPLGHGGPGGSRFAGSRLASLYRDRYVNEAMLAAVRDLGELASRNGMSPVELALRWVDDRPVTSGILLGASRPEQLAQNLDALAKGPLPDEVVEGCEEIGARLRGPMPAYNR